MRGLLRLLFVWSLGLRVAAGQGVTSPLARQVQPAPGTRPLGQVLTELSHQSRIPFSYSSSRIPVTRPCVVRPGPARPLGEVLREVLAAEHVSYGFLDGQLVLWPSGQDVPAGVVEINGLVRPRSTKLRALGPPDLSARTTLAPPTVGGAQSSPVRRGYKERQGIGTSRAGLLMAVGSKRGGKALLRPAYNFRRGGTPGNPVSSTRISVRSPARLAATEATPARRGRMASLARSHAAAVSETGLLPAGPQKHPIPSRKNGVLGFPLVLVGLNSRPVRLQLDSTAQVGPPRLGAGQLVPARVAPAPAPKSINFHFSVLPPLRSKEASRPPIVSRYALNLLAGRLAGARRAEIGGLVNVVRDTVRGVQVAGLVNATGTVGGGVQLAGVANLNRGDVRGVQGAALLNVARRDVRGLQFGLVNVARHVRGVQLGLLNLADSATGVPVGLLSLVRHGGYLHGEVWASESLPLNAVVKLGVRPFYTLLGLAAEPFGNQVEWASGLGVGVAGRPRGRLTLSLDLMQWFLAGGEEQGLGPRFCTQLRPALAWQIERAGRLQLVAGPSLNLAVARRAGGRDRWNFGENQWLWLDTVDDQNIIRLWPGVQLGLRF